ncbi:SRPBCC family protein [Intrasporangium flavum]|uniref:SRPBCC family protein n=1 Tax=Intrasporangium flavum TaxID=1428657 RepID=UPI00096CC1A4|nr:SRPBCC family protein [Intrasporangium flavum]
MFASIAATAAERATARRGDELIAPADVVMDRAFTLPAPPSQVWPWLTQLGKRRAGWYLPAGLERFLPASKRAAWEIQDRWQHLQVGDTVPDYGGTNETLTLAQIEPPTAIVYTSQRGATSFSWSITLEPTGVGTRVFLRLRMAPVRRRWLAKTAGELIDVLTIAGMATGLRQRLTARSS